MLFRGSLGLNTGNQRLAVVATMIVVTLASLAISSLAGYDESLAFYSVVAIAIFIFAFINTDFALSILILSMLLSPEFAIGGGGGGGTDTSRDVVLRFDDLLLGLITLSWLVKTAVNKDLGLFIRTPLNRPIFTYLGISFFATFLGIFNGNVSPLVGLLYNIKYFQYFLIFLMVSSHIQDLTNLWRYRRMFLITAFLVSLYAVSQIPSGVRVSAPFEGEGGEANTLGGYLVIMMSLVIAILPTLKSMRQRAGYLILLLVMLIPFAYTLSRSSWIALFPAVLVVIFYSRQRRQLIIAMILALMVLPFVIPASVYERVSYTFGQENQLRTDVVEVGDTALDPSTSARIISWTQTIKQWTQKPIFGWGVTGAGFKDAQYFRVLVETGVVGLFAFGWLLWTIFAEGVKKLKLVDPKLFPAEYAFIVGYLGGFAGMIIHGIGANTFIIVRIMEPFWFLTALVMMLPDLTAKRKEQMKIEGNLPA
ncbi:O-antigen ligase family protein [bacterium]|nr:O-antigen ligase family protein [bacterium]